MDKNEGVPALPSPEWSDTHGNIAHQEYGMTLRDYFAAKAMQRAFKVLTDVVAKHEVKPTQSSGKENDVWIEYREHRNGF